MPASQIDDVYRPNARLTVRLLLLILAPGGCLQLEDNLGALAVLPKLTPEVKARIEAVMRPVSDLQ